MSKALDGKTVLFTPFTATFASQQVSEAGVNSRKNSSVMI